MSKDCEFLKIACNYAEKHVPIHPLMAGTKRPVNAGWTTAPILTIDEVKKQVPGWLQKGYGLGVRTGYPMYNDNVLLVVDVDIHGATLTEDARQELWKQLTTLELDPKQPTVITGRDNGSCHYYVSVSDNNLAARIGAATTICKSQYSNNDGNPCWAIEILGKGKQVVTSPSIHPDTGMHYIFNNNAIITAPAALIQLLEKKLNTKLTSHSHSIRNSLPAEMKTILSQHFDLAMASFYPQVDTDKLQNALTAINADCDYEIWRNVIWAIRSHNIMDAETIAREWSKKSTKYEACTFDSVWQSFNPNGGIGAGTLYHIATENGWLWDEIRPTIQSVPDSSQCPCFRVFNSNVKHSSGNYHAGVWHFVPNENDVKGDLVCSPITIDAVTCDTSENNFGLLLTITNPLGKLRKWAMPMELLSGSGEPARAVLLSLGVRIHNNRMLNAYLSKAKPSKKIRCTPQLGWFENVFVLPDCTYGAHKQHEIVFQSAHEPIGIYAPKGTLDGWRDGISAFAVNNPLLTTAICCAFSGALIEPSHAESGGLHFYGDSSTGKTTLVQVACSIWGGSDYMRSWRATANGMEGAATMFNGTLLALDEISECKPAEVGQIIYALANGQGKQRASKTGTARVIARWKTAVISSGELTTSSTIELAGENVKAGQTVRLIDISAQRQYGAWDNLHQFTSGSSFSEHLKSQSNMNYGVAGREFLTHLVKDKHTLSDKLQKFTTSPLFNPNNATGQVKRVGRRFALLALAGELATSYGITGWETGYAAKVMAGMFQSWLASAGNAPLEKQQIIQQVINFIERYGNSRFSSKEGALTDRFIADRAGWWDRSENSERIYLFTSVGLREATKGNDFKRAIKALIDAGVLTLRETDQRGGDRIRIDGQQFRVYPICFSAYESQKD
ncbi:DUF927 domain-containing protein [Yersinia pseudotuberculosis]|uniref:DUF927 domain-containing protein n=1 Tax=Yersinia pseudotuberculosis TaxID=633 RepID=UPI000F6BAB59|nr:DUF927 domain-containing protein [Yersinia pseudotuberculosis]VEE72849.1 Zinc-binding domain of primase-helicase family [Yersinia pseudotuberculosis]